MIAFAALVMILLGGCATERSWKGITIELPQEGLPPGQGTAQVRLVGVGSDETVMENIEIRQFWRSTPQASEADDRLEFLGGAVPMRTLPGIEYDGSGDSSAPAIIRVPWEEIESLVEECRRTNRRHLLLAVNVDHTLAGYHEKWIPLGLDAWNDGFFAPVGEGFRANRSLKATVGAFGITLAPQPEVASQPDWAAGRIPPIRRSDESGGPAAPVRSGDAVATAPAALRAGAGR